MNDPDPRQVRHLVYDTFASEGRPPSPAELARLTGSTREAVGRVLHDLGEAHALVLASDGDSVRMAHPFSAAPMAFVLTPLDGHDDRRWWGGCAWDSFGISAALALDVRVDTACPQCGATLGYETGPDRPPPGGLAVWFPKPARNWWDDVVATCTMIRTFCDHGHAERWADRNAGGGGRVVAARTVWELAQSWYGDRLDPDFEPHSRDHNQGLLASCGLTGEFWLLP